MVDFSCSEEGCPRISTDDSSDLSSERIRYQPMTSRSAIVHSMTSPYWNEYMKSIRRSTVRVFS